MNSGPSSTINVYDSITIEQAFKFLRLAEKFIVLGTPMLFRTDDVKSSDIENSGVIPSEVFLTNIYGLITSECNDEQLEKDIRNYQIRFIQTHDSSVKQEDVAANISHYWAYHLKMILAKSNLLYKVKGFDAIVSWNLFHNQLANILKLSKDAILNQLLSNPRDAFSVIPSDMIVHTFKEYCGQLCVLDKESEYHGSAIVEIVHRFTSLLRASLVAQGYYKTEGADCNGMLLAGVLGPFFKLDETLLPYMPEHNTSSFHTEQSSQAVMVKKFLLYFFREVIQDDIYSKPFDLSLYPYRQDPSLILSVKEKLLAECWKKVAPTLITSGIRSSSMESFACSSIDETPSSKSLSLNSLATSPSNSTSPSTSRHRTISSKKMTGSGGKPSSSHPAKKVVFSGLFMSHSPVPPLDLHAALRPKDDILRVATPHSHLDQSVPIADLINQFEKLDPPSLRRGNDSDRSPESSRRNKR